MHLDTSQMPALPTLGAWPESLDTDTPYGAALAEALSVFGTMYYALEWQEPDVDDWKRMFAAFVDALECADALDGGPGDIDAALGAFGEAQESVSGEWPFPVGPDSTHGVTD